MTTKQRDELVDLAAEIVLDAVRNEPCLPFHRDRFYHPFPSKWTKGVTKDEAVSEQEQVAILGEATARLGVRCPALLVTLNPENEERFYGVHISHQPEREWRDVLRDIYGPGESDPSRVLTYSASELLNRVKTGELTEDFVSEQSMRHRLRCFGWNRIHRILAELELKRGLKLRIETKEDLRAKRRRQLMKFHVVSDASALPPLCPEAPNPVFRFDGDPAGVHHAFQRFVQQQLIELKPSAAQSQPLWAFDSQRPGRPFAYGPGPWKIRVKEPNKSARVVETIIRNAKETPKQFSLIHGSSSILA